MHDEATRWKIAAVRAKGKEFQALIEDLRTPPVHLTSSLGVDERAYVGVDDQAMVLGSFDRDLTVASERVDEAVMWALKHITG